MDFVQAREMVRVRYELRRLLAADRRAEARPLLERLRQLATDAEEGPQLEREIDRWECAATE
jgi:hypothetical protein